MSKQIGAAGKSAIDVNALPRSRLGDFSGGNVLGDVARLKPRDHDFVDAGSLQSRDLHRTDRRTLFEHKPTLTNGVHGSGAEPNFMTPPLRPRTPRRVCLRVLVDQWLRAAVL